MSYRSIHKHEIANEFLITAIDLYCAKKYLSALHLAGAAETIFHDTLCDRGITTVKRKSALLAKMMGGVFYPDNQPAVEDIERVMDYPKNAVKHVGRNGRYEYTAILRPKIESLRMIRRAIKSSRAVGFYLGRVANEFMSLNEIQESTA